MVIMEVGVTAVHPHRDVILFEAVGLNGGLINKHLNRLVKTACFYVIEVRDAKKDDLPNGLRDDVSVLTAVYQAVKDFETKW